MRAIDAILLTLAVMVMGRKSRKSLVGDERAEGQYAPIVGLALVGVIITVLFVVGPWIGHEISESADIPTASNWNHTCATSELEDPAEALAKTQTMAILVIIIVAIAILLGYLVAISRTT